MTIKKDWAYKWEDGVEKVFIGRTYYYPSFELSLCFLTFPLKVAIEIKKKDASRFTFAIGQKIKIEKSFNPSVEII